MTVAKQQEQFFKTNQIIHVKVSKENICFKIRSFLLIRAIGGLAVSCSSRCINGVEGNFRGFLKFNEIIFKCSLLTFLLDRCLKDK